MVNDAFRHARARARALIAGEAARLMLAERLSIRAATARLRLRAETDSAFLEALRTATGRKPGRAASLSVQSVARWLRLCHSAGDGALLAKPTRKPAPMPVWFASFMTVLRPSIPLAYRLWIAGGLAPDPVPRLDAVARVLRRLQPMKRGTP